MSYDDQEDLFSGDFDFVDEDEMDESSDDITSSKEALSGDGDQDETDLDDSRESASSPGEKLEEQKEDQPKGKQSTRHRRRTKKSSPDDTVSNDKGERDADVELEQDEQVKRADKDKRAGKDLQAGQDKRDSDNLEESVPPDSADSERKPEAEEEPPKPPTDHVVHIYELGQFKRTIQREFSEEDAQAFATQYNLTAKSYNRKATVTAREEEPASTTA